MEFSQLKSFVTTARINNSTRAAEILCITQPALSAQIKQLEEELRVKLFNRTSKGMILTEEGRALLKEAEELLTRRTAMLDHARELSGVKKIKLSVGINSSLENLRLNHVITSVAAAYPEVSLELFQEISPVIAEKLNNGVIDIGFYFGKRGSPDFDELLLGRINMYIAGPSELTAADPQEIDHILCNGKWIMTPEWCEYNKVLKGFFDRRGIAPQIYITADQDDLICDLIKSKFGLSLILENDALRRKQSDNIFLFEDRDLYVELYLGIARKNRSTRVVQDIARLITSCWGRSEPSEDECSGEK